MYSRISKLKEDQILSIKTIEKEKVYHRPALEKKIYGQRNSTVSLLIKLHLCAEKKKKHSFIAFSLPKLGAGRMNRKGLSCTCGQF